MPDVRQLLQRKLDEASVPEVTFDRFLRRRDRTIRMRRMTAGVVAVVVAVASLGAILRAIDRSVGNVPEAIPTTTPQFVGVEPPGSIAFTAWRRTGDSIYLYDPASATTSRLVDLRCTRDASGLRCPGRVTGMSFSPDGTRLAYSLRTHRSLRYTSTPTDDGLYVLDLRTGASTRILACVRPDCHGISGVAWSPNGASIAYVGTDNTATSLHLIAPDGSADRQLYIGGLDRYSPAWSPDGSQILFAAGALGEGVGSGLYIVAADRTSVSGSPPEPVNMPAAADLVWSLSWSPDGQSIAFTGSAAVDGASSRASVWVTDLEGNAVRVRALGVGWNRALSWSPDGSRIAVISDGKLVTIGRDGTGREDLTKTWSPVAPAWYPAT